ncbi:MAG: acyltransferase family protein [Clostridia bacterium]|nr:acyltransferase family protein [Clostridia bacterium]
MLEKKRLDYIDWLKAIGIYLIVLGHCLPAYTLPRTVIYTFHVPLFAFAGGLLSKKAETPKEMLSKLLKLLKRIGIPYLIWFVITSYPYMMKECPFKTDYNFKELVEIFFLLNGRPMWNAALWFIPCYFIVNLIFIVFSYLVKGNRYACLGLGLVSFAGIIILEETDKTIDLFGYTNIFSMHNVFLLLGFFCVGYVLKDFIQYVAQRKDNPRKNYMLYISLAVFIISIILSAQLNKDPSRPGGYAPMSVLNLVYNNIYVYISLGTLILTSLTITLALFPANQVVKMLSQSSFFIMATHYLFFNSKYYSNPSWKEGKWELSMHTGIKESVYIIGITLAFLYVLYLFRKKYPKFSKFLTYFGI